MIPESWLCGKVCTVKESKRSNEGHQSACSLPRNATHDCIFQDDLQIVGVGEECTGLPLFWPVHGGLIELSDRRFIQTHFANDRVDSSELKEKTKSKELESLAQTLRWLSILGRLYQLNTRTQRRNYTFNSTMSDLSSVLLKAIETAEPETLRVTLLYIIKNNFCKDIAVTQLLAVTRGRYVVPAGSFASSDPASTRQRHFSNDTAYVDSATGNLTS